VCQIVVVMMDESPHLPLELLATNADLAQQVQTGRLRLDLYYRLGGDPIRVPRLPRAKDRESICPSRNASTTIWRNERRIILRALEESGWNRTRASQSLGAISRTTLIGKMKRMGLFAESRGRA